MNYQPTLPTFTSDALSREVIAEWATSVTEARVDAIVERTGRKGFVWSWKVRGSSGER